MVFYSILFPNPADRPLETTPEAPDYFVDLNLDQIVETITAGRQDYHLQPFFNAPLHNVDAVRYRQEVMGDLENKTLRDPIESFSQSMRTMREYLVQADELRHPYQKKRWFVGAVRVYCNAVRTLVDNLARAELLSRGFRGFSAHLLHYVESDHFASLLADTNQVEADLSAVRYCLLIKDNGIRVRKYESEVDYSLVIEETFGKFKLGAAKDYRITFPEWPPLNHVEAQILDFVAQLFPDVFSELDSYCVNHASYLDETIGIFDREIQFYLAYLEYMAIFRRVGLKFCYPQVSDDVKEVYDHGGYDASLAYRLIRDRLSVVCNDFRLQGQERIFVVSGPNQGGKTTFARTFGQLHHLASIGCPVPGREAQLFLFDRLFTHFEKEENIDNLRGKLQDDLVRIHAILGQATPNSIVIMNEIFTSTTLQDAIFLGKKVMEQLIELDLLCVCVTFIDEMASLSEKVVSMTSMIVPDNPAVRTYKIVRRPADGLSYAKTIAEKHRLTYDCLKERIQS